MKLAWYHWAIVAGAGFYLWRKLKGGAAPASGNVAETETGGAGSGVSSGSSALSSLIAALTQPASTSTSGGTSASTGTSTPASSPAPLSAASPSVAFSAPAYSGVEINTAS